MTKSSHVPSSTLHAAATASIVAGKENVKVVNGVTYPAAKRHLDAGDEVPSCKRSRSCHNDTAEDIWAMPSYDLENLRSLQRHNPTFDMKLKYVQYRDLLVSFIVDVCDDFNLMDVTVHRALNYLDRLLSKHDISRQCYQLVATACILVAAKFEEQPHNVPSINELLLHIVQSGKDCKQQLISSERFLLESLQWNAHSATHLHFSHCYMSRGVLFPEDTIDGQPVAPCDKRVVLRCIVLIAKLCLHEYTFLNYEQSLVAAAATAAARSFCKVSPVWPQELQTMSGYSTEDISDCFEQIQKMMDNSFPLPDGFGCDLHCDMQRASPKSVTCLSFAQCNITC